MSVEIKMPKLGFDMEEGTIVNWLKKPGEYIKTGEAVFEVETDKATVEVEAFTSGTLTDVLVKVGETVPVGKVVGVLDGENDDFHSATSDSLTTETTSNEVEKSEPDRVTKSRDELLSESKPSELTAASPLARRIANDQGIDLSNIVGTGPRGMIVKQDILAYRESLEEKAVTSKAIVGKDVEFSRVDSVPYVREPLSKIRATIARRMSFSVNTIPAFTVNASIDMSECLSLREAFNSHREKEKQLSLNDLLIRATAITLREFPRLNSSFDEDAIRIYGEINIGIAVALEQGLITVVIPRADKKALSQIAIESKEVITRARENKLRQEDIENGTFTISNLGMYGVSHFDAIINPPEAAILAVGAVQEIPWNIEGQIKLQPRMEIDLSVDHRISDGAEAAKFLQTLKGYLEDPMNLI